MDVPSEQEMLETHACFRLVDADRDDVVTYCELVEARDRLRSNGDSRKAAIIDKVLSRLSNEIMIGRGHSALPAEKQGKDERNNEIFNLLGFQDRDSISIAELEAALLKEKDQEILRELEALRSTQSSLEQVDVERFVRAAGAKDLLEVDEEKLVDAFFEEIDEDRDGSISHSEIIGALSKYRTEERTAEVLSKALELCMAQNLKEVNRKLFEKVCNDGSMEAADINMLCVQLDLNTDSVTLEHLKNVCDQYEEHANLVQVLEDLKGFHHTDQSQGSDKRKISKAQFRQAFSKLPRPHGQRLQWVRTLRLDAHLAHFLRRGNASDGLKGLREMTDFDMEAHIMEVVFQFTSRLPSLLRKGLQQLRASELGVTSVKDFVNSKFSMDGARVSNYASLSDFHKGLEARIGTPNPDIQRAMEREHCSRRNAKTKFTTKNYNFETFPYQEWKFVNSPNDYDGNPHHSYPHTPKDKGKWPSDCKWVGNHGRDPIELNDLLSVSAVKKAKDKASLEVFEIVAVRLYTGPMYMLVSASCWKYITLVSLLFTCTAYLV